jgi:hypothetical protein
MLYRSLWFLVALLLLWLVPVWGGRQAGLWSALGKPLTAAPVVEQQEAETKPSKDEEAQPGAADGRQEGSETAQDLTDQRPSSRKTGKSLEEEFGGSAASVFTLRGQIWNRFTQDTKENNRFEDDRSDHLEVQLEGTYGLSQTLQFVLAMKANYLAYNNDNDWHPAGEVSLYNAYVNLALSHINVKVGNQVVIWGKADEISPLDNLNPEDLRDGFVRRRVERKIPIPMVQVEWSQDVYKFQGVFLPFFKRAKLDLRGTDWAFFDHLADELGPFAVAEDKPPKTLGNSEIGVRFAGKVQALDYAVSYLHTRADFPSVGSLTTPPGFQLTIPHPTVRDLARFAQTTSQPIRLTHNHQDVLGLEFETVLGSIGLRGDFAYVTDKSFLTRALRAMNRPVFQYVVGADYNGPSNLYVNFQFSQSVIQGYEQTILSFAKLTNEFYGTISKELFAHNLKVAVRYFYNITRASYYYNSYVVVQYWPNVNIELDGDFLGGPRETIPGFFRDNDQVYVTLKSFF